jgi:CHAD domain-containing protein
MAGLGRARQTVETAIGTSAVLRCDGQTVDCDRGPCFRDGGPPSSGPNWFLPARLVEAMTYRFKLTGPIAQSIRRVGLEQIEFAETKLAAKADVAAAIHDARRSLKRIRALLRLIRPGLDEALYRSELERVSGTAKLLSTARDLDVMRQTLGKLEARAGPLPDGAAERLRKALADGHDTGERADAEVRRHALQRLRRTRSFFAGKALAGIGLGHVVEGAGLTYRKARKAFHAAYDEPSDEAFHTWRKHVQLHWRHMLLLSRGWPEALGARAGEAREISRLLGEDHDHAILLDFISERCAAVLPAKEIAPVVALCRSHQIGLRAEAKPRGERLFAEPADNLEQRLTHYWSSAQALAALAPRREPVAAKRPARKMATPRPR